MHPAMSDGTSAPVKKQLEAIPALFQGTEAEAKASDGNTWEYNQTKHFPLARIDFKKPSDFERFKSTLLLQRSNWLLAEADAIDAGKSTKRAASSAKLGEATGVLQNLFNTLKSTMTPEQLRVQFGPLFEAMNAASNAAPTATA